MATEKLLCLTRNHIMQWNFVPGLELSKKEKEGVGFLKNLLSL